MPGNENTSSYPTEAANSHDSPYIKIEKFLEESNLSTLEWEDKLGVLMEEEKWDDWEKSILA